MGRDDSANPAQEYVHLKIFFYFVFNLSRPGLESESRILAKRMSIASVSSVDDSQRSSAPSHSRRSSRDIPQTPRHLPEPRKSSAIPRPSLQYSRTSNDVRSDASSSYPRVNGASSSPSFPPQRARTYSQPPSPNGFTNNPLPTPDSSRPTSPRTSDVRPTRIPIAARTRTISTSSHAHSIAQRTENRNGTNHRPYQPPTPDTSQDHWVVKASEPPQPTTPPMASIRHQASSIMNEPAPFATSSITSSIRSRIQEPIYLDPRPSNDSEERPFEHWYRGDVHRNGGVGEFRVAKHVEMLQIANYGHNLRKAVRGQPRDLSGQVDSPRGRKRADSVGAGTHESLYLNDERTKDTFYDAYAGVDTQADADDTIHPHFSASTPGLPLAAVSSSRSQTPTNACPTLDDNNTPTNATYVQAAGGPLRSSTPSAPPRTSAESTMPTPPTSGPRTRTISRTTSPTSQSSDQSHTKRRAKSPAASSPASTSKKTKIKARTPPPTSRRDDPRSSVATYPTPEGDIVNAIPTWTQPVQKSRNWDEASDGFYRNLIRPHHHPQVVLPVVARKRGLDGQYEQADGSPKPRSPEAPPVKPAPGTFGYDYTKYRPPRLDEIQMEEFGRRPEYPPLPEEDLVPPHPKTSPKLILHPLKPEEPIRNDFRQTVSKPPESPAPFSQYRLDHQVPTINVTRPSSEFAEQRQEQEVEDAGAGCCKCVIM
ncbi:hypothetical protein J3R83DRAFT_13050 [Lanmaoa asiatica]|nr:hypothetical protein J3R83DRAFT_13050 [Lanmaoa asiatica]